jgi:hypothetical protein
MSTRSKFLSITAACISFAAISAATATAAKADVLYVNGNMALNTNNAFSKIDGQPRMSLWPRNDNDSDQQFSIERANQGGGLLRQKSTGKCLNVHNPNNGGAVNVWPCDPNDVDQNFNIVPLDNGAAYLVKRAGTNQCVDSPTRSSYGLIHMIGCDPNNANQRWMSNVKINTSITNPVVPPTPQNDIVRRAKVWVDQRISYDQQGYYQGYRQDCSGFVSMAWGIVNRYGNPESTNTGGLPNYSTTLNSKDELRPGDAINNRKYWNDGHVVLFVRWVDKNQGTFIDRENLDSSLVRRK